MNKKILSQHEKIYFLPIAIGLNSSWKTQTIFRIVVARDYYESIIKVVEK